MQRLNSKARDRKLISQDVFKEGGNGTFCACTKIGTAFITTTTKYYFSIGIFMFGDIFFIFYFLSIIPLIIIITTTITVDTVINTITTSAKYYDHN